MSVINKMLRDLDSRANQPPRAPSNIPLAVAAPESRRNRAAIAIATVSVAVVLVAVAGFMFWPSKGPTVASVAKPPAQATTPAPASLPTKSPTPSSPVAVVASSPAPAAVPSPAMDPVPAPQTRTSAVVEAPKPAEAASPPKGLTADAKPVATAPVPEPAKRLPEPVMKEPLAPKGPAVAVAVATPAPKLAPAAAPSSNVELPAAKVSMERPALPTNQQRATASYRAAVDAMSQGRVDEAATRYTETLRLDAGHAAARQALVVILLDRNRRADAQEALREGLSLTRDNTAWAMLLARLQVEAGDVPGGLRTLEGSLPFARSEPDYHGVMGTLLQMQGRHSEAIAHYVSATRLAPEAGRWLLGLGMSLEEEKRPGEAKEAYRRARDSGSLARDHQAFVDQKLKQIQ